MLTYSLSVILGIYFHRNVFYLWKANIECCLSLYTGTYTKYVPATSFISIQADLLIGLGQFENSLRWKELWVKNIDSVTEESSSEEEEEEFDKEDLGTQLGPKYKGAHKDSDVLDNF